MSKIILKCSELYRISTVISKETDNRIIQFEIRNNNIFVIACNKACAVVKHLAETNEGDSFFLLKCTDNLLNYLKENKTSDEMITIETIPEFACGSISCKDFSDSESFLWLNDSFYKNWLDWFEPVKTQLESSKGSMFFNLYQIQTLFEASTSGEIVFPEFIDATKPVLVRDINDSNWFGFFIPSPEYRKILKQKELPEWLN